MKHQKGAKWAFVGYPESLPTNWQEIIIDSGLQCCVSPLHDKDKNPDESEKKEHYHFIVIYDGPTTYNNILNFTKSLNATIPIKLESVRGMYRYHLHLDNPEKTQYDDRDRLFFNGFDKSSVSELTKTETNRIKKELIKFIIDNNIEEYCELLEILIDNDFNDLFDVANSHTILFNTFLTSRRNKKKNKNNPQLPIIDRKATN